MDAFRRIHWWRVESMPPPGDWKAVHEAFVGADSAAEWGLAAAIFISGVRKKTGEGPTFKELFVHLLPDTDGRPGPIPRGLDYFARMIAVSGFRYSSALEWRREKMIVWETNVPRSLRCGSEFHKRARQRNEEEGRQHAQMQSRHQTQAPTFDDPTTQEKQV